MAEFLSIFYLQIFLLYANIQVSPRCSLLVKGYYFYKEVYTMEANDKAIQIKAAFSAVIAFGTALFGWVGWVIILWLAAMVLDYLTGSFAAIYMGQWTSREASRGLWHKLGSIAAVLVAALCDIALSVIADKLGDAFISIDYGCIITPVVAAWYIFTELGSVIENASKLGAPMPKFLTSLVAKLRKAADETGSKGQN